MIKHKYINIFFTIITMIIIINIIIVSTNLYFLLYFPSFFCRNDPKSQQTKRNKTKQTKTTK